MKFMFVHPLPEVVGDNSS